LRDRSDDRFRLPIVLTFVLARSIPDTSQRHCGTQAKTLVLPLPSNTQPPVMRGPAFGVSLNSPARCAALG